jgi:hypothetical protein
MKPAGVGFGMRGFMFCVSFYGKKTTFLSPHVIRKVTNTNNNMLKIKLQTMKTHIIILLSSLNTNYLVEIILSLHIVH